MLPLGGPEGEAATHRTQDRYAPRTRGGAPYSATFGVAAMRSPAAPPEASAMIQRCDMTSGWDHAREATRRRFGRMGMAGFASLPLRVALLAGLLVAAGAVDGWAQEKVGVNSAVNPEAQGTPPGGAARRLVIGQDVVFNERITTGEAGQTQRTRVREVRSGGRSGLAHFLLRHG